MHISINDNNGDNYNYINVSNAFPHVLNFVCSLKPINIACKKLRGTYKSKGKH